MSEEKKSTVSNTVEHHHGDQHDPNDDFKSEKYKRRIVLPMDNSQFSLNAFNEYIKKFYQPHDFIIFIHIHEPPALSGLSLSAATSIYMSEEYRRNVEESVKQCNEYGRYLKKLGLEHNLKFKVILATVRGKGTGETILEIAREHNTTMIMLGTRGLGAFSRFMLGSTSDYLVHNSEFPVCVVPPEHQNIEKK